MDSARRTLVKALLWQGFGFGMMALIGWGMTGSATLGGGIAAANTLVGFVGYLVYERLWAHVRWGRT